MHYSDCEDAFIGVLGELLAHGSVVSPVTDPNSPASGYGRTPKGTIEQLGVSFTIADPRASIVVGQHIQFDLGFGVGVLVWTLAGSRDQEWLRYYQTRSSDYLWVPWGQRLFKNGGMDQLALAVDLLKRDPASRRAYLTIHDLDHLAHPENGVPCAAGVQFFLRAGALHAVGVMRAQNAFSSLRMDLFVLCGLQMLAADRLGVPVGSYSHMCTTLHCLEDEVYLAQDVIDGRDTIRANSLGNNVGFSDDVPALLLFEEQLRHAVIGGETKSILSTLESAPEFRSEIAANMAKALSVLASRKMGIKISMHLPLDDDLATLMA